ncbi:hypothetical protein ACSBOB_14735 [Mesorhizobium sp. ASY16-5R]|uniref:hypothetical protein n=1 Tax=Mesorhizobium sp. ASY16-5R TaxID=3445772 RepID=UPI003FA0DDBC
MTTSLESRISYTVSLAATLDFAYRALHQPDADEIKVVEAMIASAALFKEWRAVADIDPATTDARRRDIDRLAGQSAEQIITMALHIAAATRGLQVDLMVTQTLTHLDRRNCGSVQ